MKISIIIPTINRVSLSTVIRSLKGQDFDEIIIINDKSACASNARNRGIDMATGDILVFIDDDIECTNDFIEQGRLFFEQLPEVDLMQGNIMGQIETSDTHMFVTANLWIKREVAKKIRFDENFKKSGHEDLDFGWRVMDGGYNIKFNSWCLVRHDGPAGSVYTEEAENLLKSKHPEKYKKLKEENNSWI